MRTRLLAILAALLVPASGCKWMEDFKTKSQGTKATGKMPEVSADQLVNFLNERADRLRSIEYSDTRMMVSGKGIPVSAKLDGELSAAQPRYFRMVSSGRVVSSKLLMGSNPQEFWGRAQKALPNLPEGIKVHLVLPNEAMDKGTCVWEAESLEKIREFLETATGDVSQNDYMLIDEAHAMGLPQ